MYDAMHSDNHMAKERELFKEVERWRQRQQIRARQRRMRSGWFLAAPIWHGIREKMHHLKHVVDSTIYPNRHSLGARK